ncbi:MAG: hypothetical protein ABW019_01390 [Chitinophagaceae bacterium]
MYLALREKALANLDDGVAFYRQVKDSQSHLYDLSYEMPDLVNTARYLMRRNKFDDALAILQLAILPGGRNSDLSFAYQLTGECYEKKGQVQLAILLYKKATDQDPGNK